MNDIIFVSAGGFLGATARYLVGKYINEIWKGDFPLGTFIINTCGSFLLALLYFSPFLAKALSREASLGVGVGFLGAFTTFSTLEFEALQLLEKKKAAAAAAYIFISIISGISAAWAVRALI